MPASDWSGRKLDDVLLPEVAERFELEDERAVPMKGLGDVAVREIHNTGIWLPTLSAENRALDGLHVLHANNRYWPRWEVPRPSAGEFSHAEPLETESGS